jgi:hypothetical protein
LTKVGPSLNQDVEGISILLSRTLESLSEAVRKFVDRLRPHYKSFEMKPLFIMTSEVKLGWWLHHCSVQPLLIDL